jgi:Flp pilus assembly protein TadD
MGEKGIRPWAAWERCERGRGAEALSRLAVELPEFFADSRLVRTRWSRLPFYATHRLMELTFVRDQDAERALVLHGPAATWWLNGQSAPIHDVNEAESLALTKSTMCDYIRFFFYFVRGGDDAFVLLESPDEVGRGPAGAAAKPAKAAPRNEDDADGRDDEDDEDDEDEDEDEEELEPLTLEAARELAKPLLPRGVDEAGRWVVDAAVAYDGVLFRASLALEANGGIEMTGDESAGTLEALTVPKGPALDLPSANGPIELEEPVAPPWPNEPAAEPPAGDLGSVFGQSTVPRPGTPELFVGRTNEQDEFRRVLELASGAAGLPDEAHVVVAHGLGGIGKSTLLRRLHEGVGPSRRGGPLVTEIVDCENEQWRNRGDYAGLGGPPIWKLLDRLYAALEDAGDIDKQLKSQVDKAFKDFRTARRAQPDLIRRARELGIADQFGHRQLSAEELSAIGQAAAGAAEAIGSAVSVPLPHVGIPINATAATVGTVLRAAKSRREGPVSVADYQALVADLERLVGQFARSLRELSRSVGPVVIFIDTGELLGDALGWLCDASRHSGSRVVWVLGLRLGDEAERFLGTIHEARLRPMALSQFNSQTVETYLRRRLGDRYPADLDIAAVTEFTHGIPLAVSLVSTLLRDGQDPASALAPFQDGEVNSVIQVLAKRYLVHANNTEELRSDLPKLYGLALLYGDVGQSGDAPGSARRDPDALAALWGVPVGTVAPTLDALAERHDFVLRTGRRLHQEVQRAVLLSLLEPFEQAHVRDMNTRAADLYRERAAAAGHRTVDAQLADQGWQAAVIALLWHTFWIDLGRGLQLLKGLFAATVALDDAFAAALVGVAAFFEHACPDDGQRLIADLRLVTEFELTFNPSKTRRDRAAASAREVIRRLKNCPADPVLAAAPPGPAYYDLLQGSYHEALGLTPAGWAALLLRAAGDVEPGGATALAVTSQARELAAGQADDYSSAPAGTQQAIISALGLITRFDPDDSIARNNLGNELFSLDRFAEAEAAYAEAASLDPGNAVFENNRATALSGLQRHDQAEAGYRKALSLDGDDAFIHRNLGIELTFMGRYAEAEASYRDALRLGPGNASLHDDLGGALFGLGRYAEAEAAYREALELDPTDVAACDGLGYALFRLGRWAEAEATYRDALRLNPKDADGHHGLGRMYLKVLGRVDEAGAELREALRLDPDYANAHATLGSRYVITGELDAARASYQRATQSPAGRHAMSEVMLGALDGRTDPSGAAGHFVDALAALDRPHQPIILTPFDRAELRALALAALGRDREATEVLERAVRDRCAADVFQRQHYELLSAAAPTGGVKALIAIWRDVIAADASAAGPWGEPTPPALSPGQPDGR